MKLRKKIISYFSRKLKSSSKQNVNIQRSNTLNKCKVLDCTDDGHNSVISDDLDHPVEQQEEVVCQNIPTYKGGLRPEEEPFNCQIEIPACAVKYSMVLTVTESWDRDLKKIPNWDRIGGEILLRKYVTT